MTSNNTEAETAATKVISKRTLHEEMSLPATDLQKREKLKKMVKQNRKCTHSTIYSQVSFMCRRITTSYEEGKISTKEAMDLIFEAHNQITHQRLSKEIVTEEMHKRLDKLEGNDKSLFGVIMANTNSSIHLRKSDMLKKEEEISDSQEKYSESYWADVI